MNAEDEARIAHTKCTTEYEVWLLSRWEAAEARIEALEGCLRGAMPAIHAAFQRLRNIEAGRAGDIRDLTDASIGSEEVWWRPLQEAWESMNALLSPAPSLKDVAKGAYGIAEKNVTAKEKPPAPDPLLGLLREAREALGNIGDIAIDRDGYTTVLGLGGLVDELGQMARAALARLDAAPEEGATTDGRVKLDPAAPSLSLDIRTEAWDRYREVRAAFVAGAAWGFERDSYLESECEAEALSRWPDAAHPPGESAGEKGGAE